MDTGTIRALAERVHNVMAIRTSAFRATVTLTIRNNDCRFGNISHRKQYASFIKQAIIRSRIRGFFGIPRRRINRAVCDTNFKGKGCIRFQGFVVKDTCIRHHNFVRIHLERNSFTRNRKNFVFEMGKSLDIDLIEVRSGNSTGNLAIGKIFFNGKSCICNRRLFVHIDNVNLAVNVIGLTIGIRNRNLYVECLRILFIVNIALDNNLQGIILHDSIEEVGSLATSRIVLKRRRHSSNLTQIRILHDKFVNDGCRGRVFLDIVRAITFFRSIGILTFNGRSFRYVLDSYRNHLRCIQAHVRIGSRILCAVFNLHCEGIDAILRFTIHLRGIRHDDCRINHLERNRLRRIFNNRERHHSESCSIDIRISRTHDTDRIIVLQVFLRVQGKLISCSRTRVSIILSNKAINGRSFIKVTNVNCTDNRILLAIRIFNSYLHHVTMIKFFIVHKTTNIDLQRRVFISGIRNKSDTEQGIALFIFNHLIVFIRNDSGKRLVLIEIFVRNNEFMYSGTGRRIFIKSIRSLTFGVSVAHLTRDYRRFRNILDSHIHLLSDYVTHASRNSDICRNIPFAVGYLNREGILVGSRFMIHCRSGFHSNDIVLHFKRDIFDNGIFKMAELSHILGIRVYCNHNTNCITILDIFIGFKGISNQKSGRGFLVINL